jgi:peptide/nickel transport system permease protein
MPGRMELLAKNTRFQVALAVVIFMIIVGIIGPFFTMNPNDYTTGSKFEPPSWNHKLGCDLFGCDVWSRLIYGIRYSLVVGFIAGLIALAIAFMIGGVGAYRGGWVDEGANLFSNVFLTIPVIPVLIVLSVLFGQRSLYLVAAIIAVISWPGAARALRSQVLSLKEREFVDLARVSGKGDSRILFGEIFPNMLAYVFIQFVGMVGSAIVMEAGISLLGLGPTNVVTLGNMLYWAIQNSSVLMGIWWWFIPPGLVIVLFTGSLIMIGSVMDDVLNPKLTGVL